MAPLLKAAECSLLILNQPGQGEVANRDIVDCCRRVQQAASLCGVPTFHVVDSEDRHFTQAPELAPSTPLFSTTDTQISDGLWAETRLATAIAASGRPSLLICGRWLDESVTFLAFNALGEGYDAYILVDASPALERSDRDTAIARLVQAGIVPTTTKQAIREWAASVRDTTLRSELLKLLIKHDAYSS